MLFEGNIAKGVLSPERFAKLFIAGKKEFSRVTVEEIEDCSKADVFLKNDRPRTNVVVRCAVSCEKRSASQPAQRSQRS